jgi:hypothetical protein
MMMKYFYCALAGISALLFPVCSCSTGEAAIQILGASSEAPVFLDCKAVSETEINFLFSLPVRVVSLRFSPAVAIGSVEEGSTVRVNFAESPGPGEKLTADLLAEDEHGNTINVLVPFRARNSRIPKLRINELRTENSKPKSEYIEFKMLSAGNLAALRVYAAWNPKTPPLLYEFPPVEVAEGEYVTLHLRTQEENCTDELGSNLDESGGADSSPTARDFWIPGSARLLHNDDAVYVLDQDDQVLDAVMLAENIDTKWKRPSIADAAGFLFSQGAWKSADGKIGDPAAAVSTVNATSTQTVCRDESAPDTDTAADWYITASKSATPGKPNSTKRYVKSGP